jgi:hypothetical protein
MAAARPIEPAVRKIFRPRRGRGRPALVIAAAGCSLMDVIGPRRAAGRHGGSRRGGQRQACAPRCPSRGVRSCGSRRRRCQPGQGLRGGGPQKGGAPGSGYRPPGSERPGKARNPQGGNAADTACRARSAIMLGASHAGGVGSCHGAQTVGRARTRRAAGHLCLAAGWHGEGTGQPREGQDPQHPAPRRGEQQVRPSRPGLLPPGAPAQPARWSR